MRIFLWIVFFFIGYYQAFIKSPLNDLRLIFENKNKNFTTNSSQVENIPDLSNFLNGDDELKRVNKENFILKESHAYERNLRNSIALISLLTFSILLWLTFTYYRKQEYYKTLYLQTITKQEPKEEFLYEHIQLERDEPIYEQLDINPLIVENILSYLNTFEQKKKYLVKDISLLHMARECGTNTAYLSKVINHYKKNNFASYLNDLRLNHAVELWKNTPKLRYKSIQGMADMVGFNTAQSFSKKFNEKYKISPTHFLKDLNQDIQKQVL
ncbi:helix-turn-helix domain-containing protein [Chryseobacterium sp. PMSZPI]|uniref:helix-turn-helix domain-containing protein n=1 Tax=Chryseobacterium sp. PMSZPI TaxID=1033900 RepID=UPI000C349B06|nr:helix-turn-helix domain-containing protein [Chryseobacterium sp. PMSZPI]PKF73649.1 hypothetical protein CW752_13220 [Chryseobacterium sp. PMSZPI]